MKGRDLKEYQRFIYSLPARGWQVKLRKGGHYKLIPPWRDAELIFAPASPSDCRVLKNLQAQVKKTHRDHE